MHAKISLLLSALVVAGASAQTGVFTSRPASRVLPLPKGDDVWHFVIYGDRTGGPAEGIKVLAQAVTDTNLLDPDLVMTVGDLVQGYNEEPLWLEQTKEFHQTMSGLRAPWYPVAGNHDVYWRGKGPRPEGQHELNYEKHFGPLWYGFRHKNSGMVVLYSDEGDALTGDKGYHLPRLNKFSDAQLDWLRDTLDTMKDLDHVFLFLHHPKWIEGSYPGNNWAAVHQLLVAAENVRAVFAGHIHRMHYDGKRDGIEYFALATTGGHLEWEFPKAGWLHHLNVVTVRKERFEVATLPVGAVINPREVSTPLRSDIDKLMALNGAGPSSLFRVRSDGSALGSYEMTLENPASGPIEVTLTLEGDHAVTVVPDHHHVKIAPGSKEKAIFHYGRSNGSPIRDFTPPRVLVDMDFLSKESRIQFPRRTWFPPLALEGWKPTEDKERFRALLLDERGACLRVSSESVRVPQGPFTVEAWIRAEHLDGRRPLVAKTENSEYALFANGGRPNFSVYLNGQYASAETSDVITAKAWHHIAGVFDGAEVRLYVDGRVAGRADASGQRTENDLPLFVGADPNRNGNPVDHFKGLIDEVRLSSTARYAKDFDPPSRHHADETTLMLLHLDEQIGPFAPDHSGRGAHGLLEQGARVGRATRP